MFIEEFKLNIFVEWFCVSLLELCCFCSLNFFDVDIGMVMYRYVELDML